MAKPILFNTDMVRAILEGRKSVTRRLVKPQPRKGEENPHRLPSGCWYFDVPSLRFPGTNDKVVGPYWPPCHPSDILYVRETWAKVKLASEREWRYEYRADCENPKFFSDGFSAIWRPSIHMPKEVARIFLRVTDIRAERLQDITGDASAEEGVPLYSGPIGERENYYRSAFATLWDSTIKPKDMETCGWESNPWVWVIGFERIEGEMI